MEKSKIPGTLKKKLNPMLVLFYYNDTDPVILSEFHQASTISKLEPGKSEDFLFDSHQDLDFKFAYVNLDIEKEIEKTFQTFNGLNPFVWARIEKDDFGDYEKIPFIIFYYQSIPQFLYEGVVQAEVIKKQLENWRKDAIEIQQKDTLKKAYNSKESYYVALEDNVPQIGIVKGKTYKVTILEKDGKISYIMKEM